MQDLTEAELAELDRLQCDALREYQRDRKIILYDQYYDQYGYATSAISTYVNLLLGLTPRLVAEVRRLRAENAELRLQTYNPAIPDDIRAEGWAVAVHNDYWMKGERYTFWLFTRNKRCVKGEGKTDAEALNQVRVEVQNQ